VGGKGKWVRVGGGGGVMGGGCDWVVCVWLGGGVVWVGCDFVFLLVWGGGGVGLVLGCLWLWWSVCIK